MHALSSSFHRLRRVSLQVIFRYHKPVECLYGRQLPGYGRSRSALQFEFGDVTDNLGTLHFCQFVFGN